jgi:hypothetical protein
MLTVNIESLQDEEGQKAWNSYSSQRIPEIQSLKPHLSDSLAEGVAWFEFVQSKWGLACISPFPGIEPLDYAIMVHAYGPDIRGMKGSARFRTSFIHSDQCRRSKTVTRKRRKKPAKVETRSSTRCNSAYTYFVKKRYQELKAQSDGSIRVADTIPIIASEWNGLQPEEKDAIAREWKDFTAMFDNKSDEPGDQ